jgi:hypothetical protein
VKPTSIHIDRVQVRVRGGTPLDPAHLADHITRALAARYRGPLPPRLTTSLTRQLAGPLAPTGHPTDVDRQDK